MDLYDHVLENIINVRLTSNPLLDEATKIGMVFFPNLFCVSHGKKKGQIEVSPLFFCPTPIQNMGVDHPGFRVFVTERYMDVSDVIAIRKQMRGNRVAEGMIVGGS